MTREEAIAAVLSVMDNLDYPTPKPGKFVGDWRFTDDAVMDDFERALLIVEVEDDQGIPIPYGTDEPKTVRELADLLVKAKA